jgi:hypothetical protein
MVMNIIIRNLTNHSAEVTINGADYTITREGNVFGKCDNPITLRPDTSGYASFTAGKKGKRTRVAVHRLVAKYFLPKPTDPNMTEVDHLDSNRMNPSADNLEWVSHEENIKRAYARGNHKGRATGEKNIKCKLDRHIVSQMRNEYWLYSMPIMTISKKHNVPWSTVNNIVKGYTWKHIPMPELTPEIEEMLKKNPNYNPRTK